MMRSQFSWSDAVRTTFLWLVAASAAFVCQPKAYTDEPLTENRLNSIVADELRAEAIAEMRLRKVLLEPTAIEFIDTPLYDVIDYLEELHDIQIELATAALDAVGLGSDTPITRNLKGISLRSALKLMLGDMELTYIIHDEVLLITTLEAADMITVTRVYYVADLLNEENSIDDFAEIVALATASHPHNPGTIVGFGDSLVAKVPHSTQHSIARLLARLRATQTNAESGSQPNPLGLFPVTEKQFELTRAPKRIERAKKPKTDEIADPFGEGVPAPSKGKRKPDSNRDPFGGGSDPPKADPFGGSGGDDPFGGGADPFGGSGKDDPFDGGNKKRK